MAANTGIYIISAICAFYFFLTLIQAPALMKEVLTFKYRVHPGLQRNRIELAIDLAISFIYIFELAGTVYFFGASICYLVQYIS